MTSVRVALVVGAGSALGESIATELGRAGLCVALNDMLPTRIDASAAAINAAGGQAAAYAADLTRKLALQTMLQAILEKWGRIDVLVFIAGVRPNTPLLDMDEWDWHRAVDTNLTAVFLCMQSVGRTMRELGGGTIINIIAASEANSAVFAAASAGLVALSEAARAEFGAAKIAVHALHNPSAAEVVALSNPA